MHCIRCEPLTVSDPGAEAGRGDFTGDRFTTRIPKRVGSRVGITFISRLPKFLNSCLVSTILVWQYQC
jgi:hypothetical protein